VTDEFVELVPMLERAVIAFVRRTHLPGASVGLVLDDRLAWTFGVGSADLATRRVPDAATLFRIASITKTFTATAIVQLRDRGRLRLDDPLARHIPEFAKVHSPYGPIEEITLRRMLTHTAGLPVDVPAPRTAARYPFEGYAIEGIIAGLDRLRPVAEPGTIHLYSDTGFQLLGEVVRRVSGHSLAEYFAKEITGPLGMATTVFQPGPELRGRCAQGYDAFAFEARLVPSRDLPSTALGALGGLWSSVEDLARWVSAQFGPYRRPATGSPVLGLHSLVEMHRQVVLGDRDWRESRGLGWGATRVGELVAVGHSGGLPGFITDVSFVPRRRLGAVVLFNGNGDAPALSMELLRLALPAVEALRDREAAAAVPAAADPAWTEMLGLYRDPERGTTFRVAVVGGELTIGRDPLVGSREPDRLVATADRLAFGVVDDEHETRGSIAFVRSPAGAIDRLTFDGYPEAEEVVAPRFAG
jgi:D-alanyl-D-alanine carboxypeptidase